MDHTGMEMDRQIVRDHYEAEKDKENKSIPDYTKIVRGVIKDLTDLEIANSDLSVTLKYKHDVYIYRMAEDKYIVTLLDCGTHGIWNDTSINTFDEALVAILDKQFS
jgi:hypothetical protein